MLIYTLSLPEQVVLILAALILLSSFIMLAQVRVDSMINTFALQGLLLCFATILMAIISGKYHLLISAALTLFLKVFFIPGQLRLLIIRLNIHREVEVLGNSSLIMLFAAGLVLFSYYVALPIRALSLLSTRNTIAISLAVVLIGMLIVISRRKAVTQVVGFMSMENGLFFAAVVSTYGMPMVVELGVAFDVLVAAILFGVFFFHIRTEIGSLDIDRLNRLTEVEK
jgi:hydrogenase-4 component E